MPHNVTNDKYSDLLKFVAAKLTDVGFSGSGPVFRIVKDGNCGLIQFQRSQTNTAERLLFTVNVGIVCGSLFEGPTGKLKKARITDAHVCQRLGRFLPESHDKWWEITSRTEIGYLTAELSDLIAAKAVPYILSLTNTTAIVSLWRSGQSPGLTERQRLRLLSRLINLSEGPK